MMKHLIQIITLSVFTLLISMGIISWKSPFTKNSQSEVEYVKLIEQDTYLIEGRTITFDVEYSAEIEREIFIQITGDDVWIGSQKQTVPAAFNERIKYTFIASKEINPGKGFKMKLNIGDVGGTFKDFVDKNRYVIDLDKKE